MYIRYSEDKPNCSFAKFISEQTLAEYLRFSARCASLTVQHKGAVMPTQADVRAAYPD